MRSEDVRRAADAAERAEAEVVNGVVETVGGAKLDPTTMSLSEWLHHRPGTRTGTFTFNGVTYTNMTEVEWRRANAAWD